MSKKAEELAYKRHPDTETEPFAYPNEVAWANEYNIHQSLLRGEFIDGYTSAEKDIIEKAVNWLSHNSLCSDRGIYFTMSELELKRFRKAMEE